MILKIYGNSTSLISIPTDGRLKKLNNSSTAKKKHIFVKCEDETPVSDVEKICFIC